MVIGPVELGNKNHCTGEGQQQCSSQSECPPKLLSNGIIFEAITMASLCLHCDKYYIIGWWDYIVTHCQATAT
jgi:hypothetical protein